jgi:hypothetical protein
MNHVEAQTPHKLPALGFHLSTRQTTLRDQVNHRLEVRRRVLKEGKALVRPPSGTIDVIIRDLSSTGARLELQPTLDLPDHFSLIIISEGTITPCALKWRRGGSAGIAFEGPAGKIGIRRF